MTEWEHTAKGHRTAPISPGWRPAGRYVLLKQVVGGPLDGLRPGDGVYLTSEEATRLHAIIRPEKREE